MDEIWGCVEYLEIPYETVMSMPVHLRKYWIIKHNRKAEENRASNDNGGNGMSMLAMNKFAKMKQETESNFEKRNVSQ